MQAYRVAARTAMMDHSDVEAFTEGVLTFWRQYGTNMTHRGSERRTAAKIVFAILPTLAASERVFLLLEAMLGKNQDALLQISSRGR